MLRLIFQANLTIGIPLETGSIPMEIEPFQGPPLTLGLKALCAFI